MKVVIPGGSGHVGTILARAFHQAGHEVVLLSRGLSRGLSRRPGKAAWRVMEWDAQTLGDWTTVIEGSDVVVFPTWAEAARDLCNRRREANGQAQIL